MILLPFCIFSMSHFFNTFDRNNHTMNVLLLGSGGRECTFAWKISQSKLLKNLYIAPGNAGTSAYGTNVSIKETDFEKLAAFCLESFIDLIIVGPEQPLADGIVDYFKGDLSLSHIHILGPNKFGAQLESSKEFAKEFMIKHQIPTARYESFDASKIENAYAFLDTLNPPYVLKADGLAAGKGVVITNTIDEAKSTLQNMLIDNVFGKAGSKVVIEEFLDGVELSVFVLTDGENYLLLPEAKDYKRIGEGNTGLNTGGMGSISPVPFADEKFMKRIVKEVIEPTMLGLKAENIPYCGFIFFGLIKVNDNPYVIEYNVRMGDPETESVFPRIKSDLLEHCLAACKKELQHQSIEFETKSATTVMLVSGGYPGDYKKGYKIQGLNEVKDAVVFHAGTTHDSMQNILTSGGRVIAITALDENPEEALRICYENAKRVQFQDSYYRTDIGFDIL